MAGLGPNDVDVCEFYDPFSLEIIRQFESSDSVTMAKAASSS